MMHLVQLLLPAQASSPADQNHDADAFASVHRELTARFGGVTAYERSPATGLWNRADGSVESDRVIMIEVEVRELDRTWWKDYRQLLERRFNQEAIMMRAIAVEPL